MFYSNIYLNKYVQIIDNDNRIIASGKVIDCKTNIENGGISFDSKWFFRKTNNLHYQLVDYCDTVLINLPPENVTWKYWRDFNSDQNQDDIDIWRDFCYDEVDIEIKPFIDRLNKIDNAKTTSSCSSHESGIWYIQFLFKDFQTLCVFVNIVEMFNGDLYLGTHLKTGDINKNFIQLTLKPNKKDSDFILLKNFCRYLENYIQYKA